MSITIGSGFRVQSVTIYPGYAQVNGEFVREAGDVDGLQSNSQSFSVSLREANQIAKAMEDGNSTFDLGLTPQDTPVDPTPRAASPATSVPAR